MRGTVTIRGLAQAIAKIRMLPIAALRGAEEGRARATARIAATAQGLAPELTGALKASIAAEGDRVIATEEHAPFQEFGTSHNAAQPFFEPALRAESGTLVDDIGNSTRAQVMRLV